MPFTLRELAIMAHARDEQEWNHTSLLGAVLMAVMGDGKFKPFRFHPYYKETETPWRELPKASINVLKCFLTKPTG